MGIFVKVSNGIPGATGHRRGVSEREVDGAGAGAGDMSDSRYSATLHNISSITTRGADVRRETPRLKSFVLPTQCQIVNGCTFPRIQGISSAANGNVPVGSADNTLSNQTNNEKIISEKNNAIRPPPKKKWIKEYFGKSYILIITMNSLNVFNKY